MSEFNSLGSSIVAKQETSSRWKRAKLKYKVDTDNDGNFMSMNIFKILSPMATVEQLKYHKNTESY